MSDGKTNSVGDVIKEMYGDLKSNSRKVFRIEAILDNFHVELEEVAEDYILGLYENTLQTIQKIINE